MAIPNQPDADMKSAELCRKTGIVERFDRAYREVVPNRDISETLGELRRVTADWIDRRNKRRTATSDRASTGWPNSLNPLLLTGPDEQGGYGATKKPG